jgi:hypothetical protein
MLMFIGTGDAEPDPEEGCGFKIVETLHILGLDITKNFRDLSSNFNRIIEKIKKTCRFWEKFKLSIMGRISVEKCLLLSQLSYFGSFLSLDPEQLEEFQTTIDNFVMVPLKVAKNFINVLVQKGGLGMISVKDFIVGLQCNWVKKAFNSTIDCWRYEFNKATNSNSLTACPENFDAECSPLLRALLARFISLKNTFYLKMKIFFNPES